MCRAVRILSLWKLETWLERFFFHLNPLTSLSHSFTHFLFHFFPLSRSIFSFPFQLSLTNSFLFQPFSHRLNAFLAERSGLVSLEEKSSSSYSITPSSLGVNQRLNPWGFHVVNVMIHALVVQMIILLARYELNCGNHLTLMTSLFFATHPIHTEAVSVFATIFSSLSTWYFLFDTLFLSSISLGHKGIILFLIHGFTCLMSDLSLFSLFLTLLFLLTFSFLLFVSFFPSLLFLFCLSFSHSSSLSFPDSFQVSSIVGRADLLAAFFSLISFLSHAR